MLNDRILGDDIARKFTASAISSVQRGATLVDRLLAFSRKQALMPKVVDADALLHGMTDLLRRTLVESIDIDMIGGDDLWRCEVDPGYLENAILNLAINARDAMSGSGRLLIETANVELDDSFAATHTTERNA